MVPHFTFPTRARRMASLCAVVAFISSALASTDTHTVQAGDTLYSLAREHRVSLAGLTAANPGVTAATTLKVGQHLRVPVVTRRAPASTSLRAASFSDRGWVTPLTGVLTTPYGGASSAHGGVDIAAPSGLPVRAGQGGEVREARYDARSGWGWTVVIDHGNGFTSRYSHNSALLVRAGDTVTRGQVIARVGSTGNSTGPHLDYRVYLNGVSVNPLALNRN